MSHFIPRCNSIFSIGIIGLLFCLGCKDPVSSDLSTTSDSSLASNATSNQTSLQIDNRQDSNSDSAKANASINGNSRNVNQGENSATSSNASSTSSAMPTEPSGSAQATSLQTPESTTQANAANPPRQNFLIDDVLKRDDLNQATKDQLLKMKHENQQQVSSIRLENLRRSFDLDYAIEKKLSARPPTQAKTEPSTAEVIYPQKTMSELDQYLLWVKFRREIVDYFEQQNHQGLDDSAKRTAIDLMNRFFDSEVNQLEDQELTDLFEQGVALEKQHAILFREPGFQYVLANISIANNKMREGYNRFHRGNIQFTNYEYPARFPVLAYEEYHRVSTTVSTQAGNVVPFVGYYTALRYWIEHDFRESPEYYVIVYNRLRNFLFRCMDHQSWNLMSDYHDFVVQQIHLPEWVRTMFRGEYYKRLAWRIRGTGFVSSVSPENWQQFKDLSRRSVGFFQTAAEINPYFVESTNQLVALSVEGFIDDPMEKWYEIGRKNNPEALSPFHYLLRGYLPQWNGSIEQMVALGREYGAIERYDSALPFGIVEAFISIRNTA